MRRRAIVVAVTAVCLVGLGSVEAARPRRALLPYELEDVNHWVGAGDYGVGVWDTSDAYIFPLQEGEKSVSVMILDDREGPVAGAVVQRVTDYDNGTASVGHAVTFVRFCSKTEAPVPVEPDIDVEITLRKGTCQDGTPSTPTSGDIVVDFHRAR